MERSEEKSTSGMGLAAWTLAVVLVTTVTTAAADAAVPMAWPTVRLTAAQVQSEFARARQGLGAVLLERLRARRAAELGETATTTAPPSYGMTLDDGLDVGEAAPEELAALDYYRNEAGYFEVNAFLRGALSSNYDRNALLAVARLMASGLNKLGSKATARTTVHRGTHLERDELERRFVIGTVTHDDGFLSACVDRGVALVYTRGAERVGKVPTLFDIESVSGRQVSNGLAGEVIFLPGTKFRVMDRTVDEGGRTVVTLREATEP